MVPDIGGLVQFLVASALLLLGLVIALLLGIGLVLAGATFWVFLPLTVVGLSGGALAYRIIL